MDKICLDVKPLVIAAYKCSRVTTKFARNTRSPTSCPHNFNASLMPHITTVNTVSSNIPRLPVSGRVQRRPLDVPQRSDVKVASSGSHGIRLAIGQQQLLCFCRAILRDAPVLCLDEANSAIDAAVEADVLVPALKWCLR